MYKAELNPKKTKPNALVTISKVLLQMCVSITGKN